jgi:hypothetical protein
MDSGHIAGASASSDSLYFYYHLFIEPVPIDVLKENYRWGVTKLFELSVWQEMVGYIYLFKIDETSSCCFKETGKR